ncbi:hypothetical protein APHAL10511_001502 [Amanita phalloides]|nr:hypothetical protein APHAL10511_001502 [Amanita phalloides]
MGLHYGNHSVLIQLLLALTQVQAIYYPVREYRGRSFFDRWDFYGNVDNTTWGNVTYLDQADAFSQGLAYVNGAGHAIMKVDNTTTIHPAPLVSRSSVRITSQDTYGAGNIIVVDIVHIPYGCSVWPSFWTLGTGVWPGSGEIDIIEAINLMTRNQYALHSAVGCYLDPNARMTGNVYGTNCSMGSGCVVGENRPNSYGAGFAQAGGGVWAAQLDVTGVYIWFWSRPDIPDNVKSANANSTLDPSSWGTPSAAYVATTCNYPQFFSPQQLVFTTTLCGVWAGVPNTYRSTCHTPTGSCVNDCVIGPGSPTYDNAYWEVSYVKTYVAAGSQLNSTATGSGKGASSTSKSAAARVVSGRWYELSAAVLFGFVGTAVGVVGMV